MLSATAYRKKDIMISVEAPEVVCETFDPLPTSGQILVFKSEGKILPGLMTAITGQYGGNDALKEVGSSRHFSGTRNCNIAAWMILISDK
jgi:hypothetical protein